MHRGRDARHLDLTRNDGGPALLREGGAAFVRPGALTGEYPYSWPATKLPMPGVVTSRPSARSWATAFRAVILATPHSP